MNRRKAILVMLASAGHLEDSGAPRLGRNIGEEPSDTVLRPAHEVQCTTYSLHKGSIRAEPIRWT